MLHQPPRADPGADFLVRRREEDHVTLERHPGPPQRQERQQLGDPLALHVERAASPHVAVPHRAAKGIDLPELRARQDDVHVMEQDERPPAAVSGEPGVQVRLAGFGLEQLRLDPVAGEHGLEPFGRLELVARRIRGVDRDVLRQQRGGLATDGAPLSVGVRELGLARGPRQRERGTGPCHEAG